MSFLPETFQGCFESVTSTLLNSCRTWLPDLTAEEVILGNRRFRIIRLLGEGGYSFVYLVREAANELRGHAEASEYALKKVLASSMEELAAARAEIAVMSRLRHPNLMPLLASAVGPAPEGSGAARHVAYMLFPLYTAGSLADLAERLAAQGQSLPSHEILHVFMQVARALQAMHSLKPQPLLHRDVKPHNVLLRPRWPEEQSSRRRGRFQAVLMDFGSCQEGRRHIRSRQDALAAQVRAFVPIPDVMESHLIELDSDMRYFMMYGMSPFERVLNQAGGSLMLAIINGSITWPSNDRYPEELRSLIKFCLNDDPQTRPYIDDVIRFATAGGAAEHGSQLEFAL